MPDKEYPLLTDDYVAGLLSQEANDCSAKYSSLGLDAYKSNKRPENQPKPNTRFLNNIIRDTNSHNRALLAKESAESKARLREFEKAEQQKRHEQERVERRSRPGPADTRKRILGDIAAFIDPNAKSASRSSKRRHDTVTDPTEPEVQDRKRSSRGKSPAQDSRRSQRDARHGKERLAFGDKDLFETSSRSHKSSSGRLKDDKITADSSSASKRRRYRDRSEDGSDRDRPRTSRHGSRHDRDHKRHHRRRSRSSRSPESSRRSKAADKSSGRRAQSTESDSDPLDDLIGPAPPPKDTSVRARGRGAHAASSGIDSRFAADYDPTLDNGPEPELEKNESDWDNTVEAFRDRQKWKSQGAERLRSAGYTEDQIKRWENGDKKDEADVQWTKRGAVRDWDRGKVVDSDGDITQKAEWGRLKGT